MPKITKARGATYKTGQVPDFAAEQAANAENDGGTEAAVVLERPAKKAHKSAWVAYAEQLGIDTSGSKPAIIKRVEALS